MAGVATFVRQGLCHHASRNVLDSGGALDSEGRCILTCIGNIAVFNVYIPNDGAVSVNLPLKIAFLRALRSAMSGMCAQGFCVVLCGDLNLSYRSADVCPGDRRVHVAECLRRGQAGAAGSADPVAEICAQLAEAWDTCMAMLATRRAEEQSICVPSQNRKETKWRIVVDVADPRPGAPDAKKKVLLGKPTSKETALGGSRGAYQLTARYLEAGALLTPRWRVLQHVAQSCTSQRRTPPSHLIVPWQRRRRPQQGVCGRRPHLKEAVYSNPAWGWWRPVTMLLFGARDMFWHS
eukprot:Tamp_05501.p2 GENE.Tamp_05501~~Tamp_05501.p2  ORF type:complete len:322 (+),score=44.43 Tamp_05501:90-968(+)